MILSLHPAALFTVISRFVLYGYVCHIAVSVLEDEPNSNTDKSEATAKYETREPRDLLFKNYDNSPSAGAGGNSTSYFTSKSDLMGIDFHYARRGLVMVDFLAFSLPL